MATDKISSRALHEKPDIAHDKLTWLQRSDADCGNRYGVLPLCIGMPVQAREHLYRKEFKILKGCHGTVCGWSRVETETASADGTVIWNKLPEYIFVRFETRTRWTIPGIDQENVFPVSVQSGLWFLDAGRANPQLKVTRYQFPIAPDFADTFYGAQGSTMHRAGRDRGHDRCRPNSGLHWDDALPHTAEDLDLPTVPAGPFFKRAFRSDGNFFLTCGSRSRWTGTRCARSILR